MAFEIFLVARPSFDVAAITRFLENSNSSWKRSDGAKPAEELIEFAGRICYMSFGDNQSAKSNQEYIENLIFQGHESVLEHVQWTFLLSGVSRAFTHQLVRHRVGFAFSQLSQQYHDESDAEFVQPAQLAKFPEVQATWLHAIETARESYRCIIGSLNQDVESKSGLPKKEILRAIRSAARSVLPNATATNIVLSANGRALRHFFRVRGSITGDDEMRRVAAKIFELVQADSPALFFDFELRRLDDGSPMVCSVNGL